MSSSLSGIKGPKTPLDTAKSTQYFPGTEGDLELVQIQDTLLKGCTSLAKSSKRRTSLLKRLLPEFDKAQKLFSRHSESHIRLPKGCTWTKFKLWLIETTGLGKSPRQLERELEELNHPGRKALKKAAAAKRKQQKDELIKLADAIVEAQRTGKDVSAAIAAYQYARSGENAPTDNLAPVSAGAAVTGGGPRPADAGKDPDIALSQPLESALAPVEMADQFAPASIPEAYTSSSSGSTAVVVADTTVVSTQAALEPALARRERRRKTTIGDRSNHMHTGPATLEPAANTKATGPNKPGDVAGHTEPVTVTGKEPIPTTQSPESRIMQSADAPSDSPRRAGAADVHVTVTDLADPQSMASKLTGLVDEVIDCVILEPAPDGGYNVVLAPAALAKIKSSRKWKRYLLNGPVDLFDQAVPFSVIRTVLDSLYKAQESTFRISTRHPERMNEYEKWEKSKYPLWHFPINLTISVPVQSALDLERLDIFAESNHELKSVSFAGFVSDPSHPLFPGDLVPRLLQCNLREILVEARHARPGKSLTSADADCIALIAGQSALGHYVVAL
jgi:hypothetical protein